LLQKGFKKYYIIILYYIFLLTYIFWLCLEPRKENEAWSSGSKLETKPRIEVTEQLLDAWNLCRRLNNFCLSMFYNTLLLSIPLNDSHCLHISIFYWSQTGSRFISVLIVYSQTYVLPGVWSWSNVQGRNAGVRYWFVDLKQRTRTCRFIDYEKTNYLTNWLEITHVFI
jgi:hypothetical protein